MKKLVLTMLTVLSCGAAYALPVGNPSDASLLCDGLFWEGHCGDPCDPCLSWCDVFSVRIGFYGDYVYNRHMEVDSGDHPDIEHFSLYTNAGFIAANIWDRLDFFATLGATNIWIDTNASAFNIDTDTNGERIVYQTDSDFSWSVGLRGTIWECGCTTFGVEGQYFYTRPQLKRITRAASFSTYPDDDRGKYYEWQVGIGIAHRINLLVPYAALKWAGSKCNFNDLRFAFPNQTDIFRGMRNKKLWGYALGVSLVDCEKASLTVEGRWGDEKAVHVNGQVRF